jgi:3-methyladenine DNA glycosylase AlkD
MKDAFAYVDLLSSRSTADITEARPFFSAVGSEHTYNIHIINDTMRAIGQWMDAYYQT